MPRELKALGLDLLLTRACPMDCVYCRLGHRSGAMSRRTWRRAVDLLLLEEGPLELQLMGGEPLLEYGLMREILAYASARAVRKEKSLRLGVTTNGLLLTPERSREREAPGARGRRGEARAQEHHRIRWDTRSGLRAA